MLESHCSNGVLLLSPSRHPSICELSRVSIVLLTYPSGEIQPARQIQHVDHWAFIEYGCAHYQYDELEEFIRVRLLPPSHPSEQFSSINTNL